MHLINRIFNVSFSDLNRITIIINDHTAFKAGLSDGIGILAAIVSLAELDMEFP